MTLLFAVLTKMIVQKLQHIRLPSSCVYPQYKYVYISIQRIHAHGHELISGCVLAEEYNLMLIFASYYYAPVYTAYDSSNIESGAPF